MPKGVGAVRNEGRNSKGGGIREDMRWDAQGGGSWELGEMGAGILREVE